MKEYLYILFFIIILLLFLFFLYNFIRKDKLNSQNKEYFKKILNNISKELSPKQKIIDFDKLYHKILLKMGYEGDFGYILKQKPKEINNLNEIWDLHKLRNSLVHDFNKYNINFLNKKASIYEYELKKLLK